jgi:hypothetical protein
MFASGVTSSAPQSIASFQLQQQQRVAQQFQSLAAEFQSGGLSTAQSTALTDENLPASPTAALTAQGNSSSSLGSSSSAPSFASSNGSASGSLSGASFGTTQVPANWDHRPHIPEPSPIEHDPVEPAPRDVPVQPVDGFGSGTSSAAQSYSASAANLQQLSLSSELTAATIGAQTSSLSLTF